jgi:hypothetical protein
VNTSDFLTLLCILAIMVLLALMMVWYALSRKRPDNKRQDGKLQDNKLQDNDLLSAFLAKDVAEYYKLGRDIWQKEDEYLRDKDWRIFSWVSTVLLGSIGGALVLTKPNETQLDTRHRYAGIVAIVAITLYAIIWTLFNERRRQGIEKKVQAFHRAMGLNALVGSELPKEPRWVSLILSYPVIIEILAGVAIVLLWIV